MARRHSYRGPFRGVPVSRADLRRIVQAGLQAPSGRNGQTTRFVIIDDGDLVAQLRALHATNTAMREAQAFIACIVDREPPPVYHHLSFAVEDCAAAVENMLLAITALGYASVWIDGWLRLEGRAEQIGELIGVPAESWPQKEKLPFEQRAWFNRYPG
jgi:nitroreductase